MTVSSERKGWPEKRVISSKFTLSRETYASSSSFHDKLSEALFKVQPKSDRSEIILEIGSHTGTTTRMVKNSFPKSAVVTLDLQREGTGLARHVQGDGEALPFDKEIFEMVISGSTFQWFSEMEQALKGILDCMKPGGLLGFTQFLSPSLEPFSSYVKEVAGGERFLPLMGKEELLSLVSRIGKLRHFSLLEEVQTFKDFGSLHRYIRNMGVGAPAVGQGSLTKTQIRDLKMKLCRNNLEGTIPLKFSGALVWLEKAGAGHLN